MVYCCACGLNIGGISYPETFDLDDDEIAKLYDKEILPESQLEWTESGYCTVNDTSFDLNSRPISDGHGWGLTRFTTVTGKIVHIRECIPGFPSDGHFPDLVEEPDSFFPFHLKCLSLVDHIVSQSARAPANKHVAGLQNIRHFYEVLDQLRPLIRENPEGIAGEGIEWTHGYYGARNFWFHSWTMERGWEFLVADPFKIPNLTEYILSNLDAIPISEIPHAEELKQASSHDVLSMGLEALPVELLDNITSHLSLHSILHLHRTSRSLSLRISLGQVFWRDQLVSHGLVPFLWDLDHTACREKDVGVSAGMCWDWRTLARNILQEPFVELALKDALAKPWIEYVAWEYSEFWHRISRDSESNMRGTAPLGLVNRARIGRIIKEAVKLARSP